MGKYHWKALSAQKINLRHDSMSDSKQTIDFKIKFSLTATVTKIQREKVCMY